MQYEEIECIGGRLNVILVKDTATNELFVKKVLKEYDVSIYRYLKDNPIAHMPRIEGIYEGDNYLVIVERGTHEELLALNGYYRKLNDMQQL